jgi:mannose-6-phosphate isomerase-like protein (cupin superfamily)
MTETVQRIRRIVTIDDPVRGSVRLFDGPAPDVSEDPARPGYRSTRLWVVRGGRLILSDVGDCATIPPSLEPPPSGSVCRIVTFPPDEEFMGKIGQHDVEAFFRDMGSPGASTYLPAAPHPYMQKTRSLDLCIVLEGEITLVLDTEEVDLRAGDTVVQRGTNHAWSNRSGRPCTIAIAAQDGA